MADREKTIKGLECCGTNRSCIGCPYVGELFDGCYGACISYLNRDALELLKEQPDIVRCGECKYYSNGFCYNPNTFDDEKTCGNTVPDWFCADGKRRNQDEDES